MSHELEKNWAAFNEAKEKLEVENFGKTVLLPEILLRSLTIVVMPTRSVAKNLV